MKIAIVAALSLLTLVAAVRPARAVEAVRGVVHVHSDLSTGDSSIEELVAVAERQGIGALLLAENYLLRVEYGLAPFRALTRVTHEERSVHARVRAYLERVARAQAQTTRVVLVPGVEVMPHYFWTGSPFALAMQLRQTQKNLLVFGVRDAAALGALPVVGNEGARVYGLQSLVDALPVLLVIPGAMLLLRTRRTRRRLGRAVIVVQRRAWLAGTLLVLVGVAAAVRGWPFTVDAYPPYADYGIAPHQALIEQVDRLGGATVWSFPEARDAGERAVGPLQVSWLTEPYGDDLLRAFRYTAFGAVYEDTTRVERPGGEWDRLLREYAAGERSRAAWALGESGYHGPSAGKRVGTIETVFVVADRTEAGVLDALKHGRMYARQRTARLALDLTEYGVMAGPDVAGSGDVLSVAAGTPLELGATVAASDGGRHDVRITLVRNGAVQGAWTGTTPLRVTHREHADGTPVVFRLEARGPDATRLVTNPIIIRAAR